MAFFAGLTTASSRKTVIISVIILVQIWAFKFLIPAGTFSNTIEHRPQGLHTSTKKGPWNDTDRPLVTYAYHETDVARENLKFFVEKALHGAADFIFIINGETNATALIPTDLPNVRVVKRPNRCFDLGGIGEVLRKDNLWKNYKRFITMNASLRGPFWPIWSLDRCWTDVFLDKITDRVKLVGSSVNCRPRPHVQSMIFATDAEGMAILVDKRKSLQGGLDDNFGKKEDPVAFGACYETMHAAIHAEVGSTSLLRNHGYEVDAMLGALHAYDNIDEYCAGEKDAGHDVYFNNRYYGFNIHPYEVVFFKANRHVDPEMLEHLTRWHLSRTDSSWDSCKQ
ncbi:hypothetical protein MKZ38_010330 [Zalerion maritima]|uniref:Uncharacterized protein n=1 Tax=Zalerion maritima TaxID=339359 RepID=A0AAD5WV85_9PEZI|nr:hypothetical protein MKZ38_010330 [Zalerion maritima]